MSRQIVVTLPEWTEIKGINNKQFADLLPTYDELLNLIKNGTPIEQEPKTGHWISIDEEPHEDYECDKCGYVCSTFTANIKPHEEFKYCPYCGCKMESEG